jgi:hypothetical protein
VDPARGTAPGGRRSAARRAARRRPGRQARRPARPGPAGDRRRYQVPSGHAVHHLGEPAHGAVGGEQGAVGAVGPIHQQPGRELVDEDGVAGRRPRGPPRSPVQPDLAEGQRDASCLLSSQTPRSSLADSTSDAAPNQVAAVSPCRTRYAAESPASQSLPRQSRRVTTTASSPTGSTWTERSPSVGRPVTGRMAPVSTSSTNAAGSLATSSRSPAWPSWPGRGPAAPGRSQPPARVTSIAAATSSTPSPAASIPRARGGRGGRWSGCPAPITTLVPDPAGRGSRRDGAYALVRALRARAISRSASRLASDWRLS